MTGPPAAPGDGGHGMDATRFQFTVTMPGDARLTETLRDLTAHAARYAELGAADARRLVGHVVDVAGVAAGADLMLTFDRTPGRLDVAIEWDGTPPGDTPAPSAPGTTRVEWSHSGRRQRCLVSHRGDA